MKLKIILFPMAIVVTLWIAIGYLKPMVSESIALRQRLEESRAVQADIEQQVETSKQLSSLLEQNGDLKKTVMHYLPDTKEGETLVDSINFLGTQVGVSISGMNFTESPAQKPVVTAPVAPPPSTEVLSLGNSGIVEQPVEPVWPLSPDHTKLELTANGSYQNIKEFLRRVAHTNRYLSFDVVVVEHAPVVASTNAQSTGGDVDLSSDALRIKATIDSIHFPLLTDVRNASVNTDKNVFSAGEDFSQEFETVRKLNNFVAAATAQVPAVTVSGSGKGNPFVK